MCFDKLCAERQRLWRLRPSTLVTARSAIAGTGLFADRHYRKGEFLTYYSGTVLDDVEAEGDRVLQLSPRRMVDGAGSCRVAEARGDYANHADSRQNQNARFRLDGRHPKRYCLAYIEAIRAIDPGEEVLVDYGSSFRF